jgi:hypothetical protein
MEQPTIRRGKRLWWSSPNPAIEHNRKFIMLLLQNTCKNMCIPISKNIPGMSIKHGCQKAFIAQQPYLDQNLC